MPKLSIADRNFVVRQRHDGHGYKTIMRLLKEQRDVTVTQRTIRKLCDKFEETGSVSDRKRTYDSKFGTPQHREYLDQLVGEKPDYTSKELAAKVLQRFNIEVSRNRINVMRRSLGYESTPVRYCQLIRDVNKVKRLEWCQDMIQTQEQFNVNTNK